MAHRYESIRELDVKRGGGGSVEMLIEKYMEPRPFRKLGPWGGEEFEETTIGYVCSEREACLSKRWKAVSPKSWKPDASIGKYGEEEGCVAQYQSSLANRSNRIRVKNVYTGVLFEFSTMSNSARLMGGHVTI